MRRLRSMLLLTLALALSGQALAQRENQGSLAPRDRAFIDQAAMGGIAEVKLGKLAIDRATSRDVKLFAQRMVDEHARAGAELSTLAAQKGVTLPAGCSAENEQLFARLSKLSGGEFDRAYIDAMVKDHDEDVLEFRKQSREGKDLELRNWAGETLPTLEEHDAMAHRTAKMFARPAMMMNQ